MSSPTVTTLATSPISSPSIPDEDHVPRRSRRSNTRFFIGIPLLLVLTGGVAYFGWSYFKGAPPPFNGPTWPAAKERLQLSIVERGTLESAENSDVVVRVKAGKKGNSGIIKWVIDDGTQVEKGQKLVDLDDSALQEELKEQINKVNKARADWISAKENYQITESQNHSEIETAKTAEILAGIELKKFLGEKVAQKVLSVKTRGDLQLYLLTYMDADMAKQEEGKGANAVSEILQTMSEIQGRIEIAQSDREMLLDRASWSQRMVKKGYLSRSQADADKSRLGSAEFTLRKAQVEYDLFRKYTIEQKITELWSKVKEMERSLDRVNSQAISKLNTARADLESKRALLEQEADRQEEIEDEIQKCILYAPQSGLVVYHASEQSRFGSGSQQSIVAQGEPVKEGQKLMRIPNLARMLVNTRVHEAMVSKVRGEINRPTGFVEALRAAFSINSMPMVTAINHVAFAEVRDEFRDKEFETVYPGQRVFIRVEAYPAKLFQGHVKSVGTVASQADWMSSDVKVYQTMVSIDDTVLNLKPGMSAEVTILAEESAGAVLTIPIQSVVGSVSMGAKRKVYVLDDGQPKERDIVVGRSNDKMVEVKEGIEEGERVVLNPRPLLGEKSGMKAGTPSTRRGGVDTDDSGGAPATGKKGGGKKGGGMPGGMPPGAGPGGPGQGPPGQGGPPGGFNPGGAAPGGGGKQFNRPEDAAVPKKQ